MNTFPILLADIEGLLGVVFFIIAFIGWIMNLSKENKEVKQRKGQPQRPQAKAPGMQNEIDQFLKETKRGERKRQQSQQAPRRDEFLTDDDIVIVEDAPQRPATQQRQRKRVTQSQPTPQPVQKTSTQESVPRISKAPKRRKQRVKPISAIKQHVDQALPHSINQTVASHLGTFTAAGANSSGQRAMAVTTRNKKTPATAIISMMRTKTRVRDAIIINEVLNKPLYLRRSTKEPS